MLEFSYDKSKSKLMGSLSMFQKQVRLTVALEMVQEELKEQVKHPERKPRRWQPLAATRIQKRQRKMLTGLRSAGGQLDLFSTSDEV